MRIDDQSFCLFRKLALQIVARDGHRNAQNDPLAPAAVCFRTRSRPSVHKFKLGERGALGKSTRAYNFL
jgi:hypothetical protein